MNQDWPVLFVQIQSEVLAIMFLGLYHLLLVWYLKYEFTGRLYDIGPAQMRQKWRNLFTFSIFFKLCGGVVGFFLGKAFLGAYPFHVYGLNWPDSYARMFLCVCMVAVFWGLFVGHMLFNWQLPYIQSKNNGRGWSDMRWSRYSITIALILQGICVWVFVKTAFVGVQFMDWL